MNELQFASKVRQVLNQGTRLRRPTAERLRAARERALAAYRPQPALEPAWAAAPAGDAFGGLADFALRVILPVTLVVLSAIALSSWQQSQRLAEIEAIDAELLTDDLPIDALLDRGFEAWLKKQATR